jgi:hypothetical protein
MSLEPLHAAALDGIRRKLAAHPVVTALVPAQVFADGDSAADEWARCAIVKPGKNYGTPKDAQRRKLLGQRDAWVECRAESGEVLNALCEAVVKALNGAVGTMDADGLMQIVHTHTGKQNDWAGGVLRTLVFGAFVVAPSEPEAASARASVPRAVEPPAPPKLSDVKKGE